MGPKFEVREEPWVELPSSKSRHCPVCESTEYSKAEYRKDDWIVVSDRICSTCDTRYSPVPSMSLAMICLAVASLIGIGVGYTAYDQLHIQQLPMELSLPAIVIAVAGGGMLTWHAVQIIRWNRRAK